MCIYGVILVFANVLDHEIERRDLVQVESSINSWSLVRILVEKRICWVNKLLVLILQQALDTLAVKRQKWQHTLHVQLKEHLEENQRFRLVCNDHRYLTCGFASENTLHEHQLSQSWLMDLDFVDVFKMGLPAIVIVLLLNYDSSIVVELAPELDVICKLDS